MRRVASYYLRRTTCHNESPQLASKIQSVHEPGPGPVGRHRQPKDINDEHSYSKLRANGAEASHHGLLVLYLVGPQAHLSLVVELGVTIMN